MERSQIAALILLVPGGAVVAVVVWLRRSLRTRPAAITEFRALGIELVRLPGRLRRLAADPRTPRRAKLALIGLAIYVASPIDPIPDFLPGVGFLDELVLVPLLLGWIRRMIPPEVWAEHFPPRPTNEFRPEPGQSTRPAVGRARRATRHRQD